MSTPSPAETVPVDSDRWRMDAVEARIVEHLGRPSLRLKGGLATLPDVRLADGWIEFDVAFSGERGFMGGVWRVQEGRSAYEEFYLRPHQSGNPDATQYTPVFHGVSGWQLYHGPRYAVPLEHRFDEWTHVKIVFSGPRAEFYVGDMEEPALAVAELKLEPGPGAVGLSAGNFAPGYFSRFSYTAAEAPPLRGRPPEPEPVPVGVVPSWWVSDVFPEAELDRRHLLAADDLAERRWTRLAAEPDGLANLARVQGVRPPDDTVFARAVIRSEREQVKELRFGFSDRVRVYLNGRLLYRGDDTYRSRDYRFLGSIGFFDRLYLPLGTGDNELLMAVSETFGGWGVQARLSDLGGVVIADR